jgi:hypothetical protein
LLTIISNLMRKSRRNLPASASAATEASATSPS